MKQIGHVDGATTEQTWRTHSLGMLAPHDLFIPNPGERENIDAEAYEHIGWVIPDKDGGGIYPTHADACVMGDDPRPAYIRRVLIGGPISQDVISTRTITGLGLVDPMDVRRSEFEAHVGALDSLSKAIGSLTDRLRKLEQPSSDKGHMLTQSLDAAPSDLSIHSTDDLIKEALEFCDTGLGGWDGAEVEAGCERAGVYIRELIGRLRSALRPKLVPTVQAEQPMSFYDHAFIAAYMAASETMNDSLALKQAHNVASILTRNRAVPA